MINLTYETLQRLWNDLYFDDVGCDADGELTGPMTKFGSALTLLGGRGYMPLSFKSAAVTHVPSAIANRDALLAMVKAIDEALPEDARLKWPEGEAE